MLQRVATCKKNHMQNLFKKSPGTSLSNHIFVLRSKHCQHMWPVPVLTRTGWKYDQGYEFLNVATPYRFLKMANRMPISPPSHFGQNHVTTWEKIANDSYLPHFDHLGCVFFVIRKSNILIELGWEGDRERRGSRRSGFGRGRGPLERGNNPQESNSERQMKCECFERSVASLWNYYRQ